MHRLSCLQIELEGPAMLGRHGRRVVKVFLEAPSGIIWHVLGAQMLSDLRDVLPGLNLCMVPAGPDISASKSIDKLPLAHNLPINVH